MKTTSSLTPDDIVAHLKSNPGLIQGMLYPNPGEPQLNEAILYDSSRWEPTCMTHGDFCKDCLPGASGPDGCGDPAECFMWVFYPNFEEHEGEDVLGWPDTIDCRIDESGKISFDAD